LVGGAQRHRTDRNGIAGLPKEDTAAADDVIGADGPELGAGVELRDAGVEAGADDKAIAMPEQLVGVVGLRRKSAGGRARAGAIDFAQDRAAEGVGKLRAVQA